MIWAVPDTTGSFALYSSSALYGDSWETPIPLGADLGEGGDANYPFLMPDGVTLYYANDGANSLGGLDAVTTTGFCNRKTWGCRIIPLTMTTCLQSMNLQG